MSAAPASPFDASRGENERKIFRREAVPHIFRPIELRSVRVRNRIMMSPMSQYSATDGLANDWHFQHLASRAVGGAGIVFTEVNHVERCGPFTPHFLGLWNDEQRDALGQITRCVKAQGAAAGIQLGHAGRKASTSRPWQGNKPIAVENGGWRGVAPSGVPVAEGYPMPVEMDTVMIAETLDAFAAAARRSREAGFDIVEIHAGHGYLIHEFLSPLSNRRSDHYGGSFENRTRLLLEVVAAVRSEWPEKLPLFVRISSSSAVRCSRIRTGRCMRRRPCAQGSSGPCSTSARTSTRYRSMDLRLSGKTALVTGASSVGIGRVIAIGLAEEGVRVAITARRAHLLDEIAKHGVTVNCIQPGRISSEQMLRMYPTEEKRRAFTQEVPIARFGEPQELSELTIFLCSPRASYITGTVIPVDGGLSRFAF